MEQTLEEEVSAAEHYERGLGLKRLQIYKSAIEEFKEAATDPEHAGNAYAQIGLCYKTIGRYIEAVAAFRKALKSPSFSPDERVPILYLTGRALELLGRYAESLETYRWVYGEDPAYLDVARRIEHLRARRTTRLRPLRIMNRSWADDLSKAWQELRRQGLHLLGRGLDTSIRYAETLEKHNRLKGSALRGLKALHACLTQVRQTIPL